MTRTSRWVWSVVALTGVAAVPRFWELGRKDFWTDEAMDVLIATGKCFWDRVAYYLPNLAFGEGIVLLTSAGASTTVLRVFPAVMSVLCVPLAVAIARLYRLGERESLVAGLLLAISPLQIVYAQEIRQYSAVAAYGLLAHLLIVAWMENGRRVAAIGWLLLTLVGSFTQGFLVFSAVHLGWIFLRAVFGPPDRRVAFRQVVAPLTAGALLFAVSVAASVVHTIVFRNHLMKVESYPGVTPFGMLEYLLGFLFVTPCLGACAVLLAAVGAWDWLRRRQALPLMLSIGFFVSTILAFRLFGSTKFSIRFWLPIQPFLVVLVVAGLGVLRRHRHGASLANLFVIAWVAFGALGIVRIHQRPGKDIAAYDVKRDVAMLRQGDERISGFLLKDFYALALLPRYRDEFRDRPVYLTALFPDYVSTVFGRMEPAPCPPSATDPDALWVVADDLLPAHRSDQPFTNDIAPWWGFRSEHWQPSAPPSFVPGRDLSREWFEASEYLPGERRIVRWLDAPAGSRTCFVAEAWKEAKWDFLKHVPGYGLDVTTLTGPPVDPAQCPGSGAP